MAQGHHLDFDAVGERGALDLVRSAFQQSQTHQQPRANQSKRNYELYSGFIPAKYRDPDRANVFIPKIRSIVETLAPREIKALFSTRPYMPIETKRKEFQETARIQSEMLDEYMDKANLFEKSILAAKIKILDGNSFLEPLPYFENITEKVMVPQTILGIPTGEFAQMEQQVPRLRFKINVFAPWEVYVDPLAVGLENKGDCRYLVKFQLVSKRQIIQLAEKGAYPGFDVEGFQKHFHGGSDKHSHWGLAMLSDIGLGTSGFDDDVMVLLRYESEERYIDVLDGQWVLRDVPNPFKHGLINLARWPHTTDPHTQNRFWAEGEAKPNEILQQMLNDTENMTLNNHMMTNQLMIYYRKGVVDDANSLVRVPGNRVELDVSNDRPISDSIFESAGQPLPRDHYLIPERLDRWMDITSGVFDPTRGQPSTGQKTATESALLKETGDIRHELHIRTGEMVCFKDFAQKCLYHIDQFATPDDIVEVVGLEDAVRMMAVNPADLPGGYNFAFKGSDRLANQLIRQRNLKELAEISLQVPNVLPGAFMTKLYEAHNFSDKEIRELIIPDEIMIPLQAKAAEQERAAEAKGATQGPKRSVNSPRKEAERSAATLRGN